MPFTVQEFLNVFVEYNESIYPLQFFFYISAVFLIFTLFRNHKYSGQIISYTLGVYWLWIGIYYHLLLFTSINPAAFAFGIIFILQGFFFILEGGFKKKLSFKFTHDLYGYIGALFVIYSLIIYPLLGTMFGHVYPAHPTFGLPCPTTIFTFGMLLFLRKHFPYYIIGIPLIWTVIGSFAAIKLTIYEDFGLLVAGLLGTILLIIKNRKMSEELGS